MNELTFLGNGSAFHYGAYNTAAYFFSEETLIIFDCGESICNRLIKLGVLTKADKICVFITHTHSDHIGSLEALIYYNEKFLHKEFHIFYPRAARLKQLLKLTGVDFPFEIEQVPNELAGYKIDCVPQKHIPFSYGFFFYGEFSFFYSGDTCKINPRAVNELNSGKIDRIYHEATCSSSPIHTHISELKRAFPTPIRDKVCLMHFDSDEFMKECEADGFLVAEVNE
ncbi:MAG: MBL fold metallo-hydrolase [Clostridiales bacterium]|nr:MBL fold metallo-hydrolase [Clostridiales bacterium]